MKAKVIQITLTLTVDESQDAEKIKEGIEYGVEEMADGSRAGYDIISHEAEVTSERPTTLDVE